MAGIYVHIPFCKKACHYCNFHFSTSLGLQSEVVNAICREIELHKNYLDNEPLSTIYFGGGTPSLLKSTELESIFDAIHKSFDIEKDPEITLEANPDDLHQDKIKDLFNLGVNRLSIGIQSFYDIDLKWMNRSHNSIQAHEAIYNSQEIGIDDISVDLIFGSPTTTMEMWQKNLELAAAYHVNHLSCYSLTVEEKTALYSMIKKNKTKSPNEELAALQFQYTVEYLRSQKYKHYEISNYAKNGKISRHNTNYWMQEKYLGIGPSAHSYNNLSRQWNVSNNKKYVDAIHQNIIPCEIETLSKKEKFNEYLMTGLRTVWGCDSKKLQDIDKELFSDFLVSVKPMLEELISFQNGNYTLKDSSKLIADSIIAELFIN